MFRRDINAFFSSWPFDSSYSEKSSPVPNSGARIKSYNYESNYHDYYSPGPNSADLKREEAQFIKSYDNDNNFPNSAAPYPHSKWRF